MGFEDYQWLNQKGTFPLTKEQANQYRENIFGNYFFSSSGMSNEGLDRPIGLTLVITGKTDQVKKFVMMYKNKITKTIFNDLRDLGIFSESEIKILEARIIPD